MNRLKRETLKEWLFDKLIDTFSFTLTLLGLAGLAGYIDGEGSGFISVVVLIIGIAFCVYGYQRDAEKRKERRRDGF